MLTFGLMVPAAGKFVREYVDATVPEMAFGEVSSTLPVCARRP